MGHSEGESEVVLRSCVAADFAHVVIVSRVGGYAGFPKEVSQTSRVQFEFGAIDPEDKRRLWAERLDWETIEAL